FTSNIYGAMATLSKHSPLDARANTQLCDSEILSKRRKISHWGSGIHSEEASRDLIHDLRQASAQEYRTDIAYGESLENSLTRKRNNDDEKNRQIGKEDAGTFTLKQLSQETLRGQGMKGNRTLTFQIVK